MHDASCFELKSVNVIEGFRRKGYSTIGRDALAWFDTTTDTGWPPWPSTCESFGGSTCRPRESRRRQRACLEWVDRQLAPLLQRFRLGTVLVCADRGDCEGENELCAHGISRPATLTVPLILRDELVHA